MGVKERLALFGVAPLCNRKSERAPHIGNFVFPLCWRCSGILAGAIFGGIFLKITVPAYINALIFVPLIVDGGLQYGFGIMSNNTRRWFTGILFGFGLTML